MEITKIYVCKGTFKCFVADKIYLKRYDWVDKASSTLIKYMN